MSWKRLTDLPPSALAIALVLLLLTGALMLRRVRLRLLGPVFVAESDRVARKGRIFLIRVLFGLSLLGVLYFVYPEERPLPPNEREYMMQHFAHEFTQVFLIAQSIVVLLLTPIYMSGAISEEKERGSLDFLLGTQLSSMEIVLGKLFSRMLPLLGLALTSLPVLAMTQLWGGVDLPRVLAGWGALVFSVLSLSALSMLCSVLSRRTLPALGATYAIYFIANLVCLALLEFDIPLPILDYNPIRQNLFAAASPIGFQVRLHEELRSVTDSAIMLLVVIVGLVVYGLLHLVIFFALSGFSILLLRRMSARGVFSFIPVPSMTVRKPTAAGETMVVVRRKLQTYVPLPRMGRWPLVWKECHVGKTVLGGTFHDLAWMLLGSIVVMLGVFGVFVVGESNEVGITEIFNSILRVVMVVSGISLMLGIGLSLAGSITRERERQTLESLLALPIGYSSILWAKTLGAIYRQRRPLAVFSFAVPFALLTARPNPGSWVLLPLALIVHAGFASAVGLLASVVCRSTFRANVTLVIALVTILVATWIVNYTYDSAVSSKQNRGRVEVAAVYLLNPVHTWWLASERRSDSSSGSYALTEDRWHEDAEVCGAGIVLYALATLVLYFVAHQHFRWRARHA